MAQLFFDEPATQRNINTELDFLRFKRRVAKKYPWLARYARKKSVVPERIFLALKRLVDLLAVIVALPFVLPVFVLVAVIIKLEDPKGQVFFLQKRTGRYGKRFDMYKFRTMVYNAEELKAKYAHLNELQWPDFKIKNDPRVTRIGRILRKTSLDELPQLLNVLKNEMSLVGPRPTSFRPDTYKLWQTARLDIKPGITGLWQIIGRGEMEFTDRVHLDIFYIEHRSIMFDVEILVRTVLAVFARRGTH